MRRDKPPVFITSPASMKNGTAISGKLSAPLMMFCATICESKISSWYISATPQTISANAIGMPSAMAPSNDSVNTAIVMQWRALQFFGFPHCDEFLFAGGTAKEREQGRKSK